MFGAAFDQDAAKAALARAQRESAAGRKLPVRRGRLHHLDSRRQDSACVRPCDHQPAYAIVGKHGRSAKAGRSDRSRREPGSARETRRTVNCGSSASAVPTPTTTASTRARSRCRCASPAAPVNVVRMSADGGNPGVDRLAELADDDEVVDRPRRNGPKISCQGGGSEMSDFRSIRGTSAQVSVRVTMSSRRFAGGECHPGLRGFFRSGRHRVMIFGTRKP